MSARQYVDPLDALEYALALELGKYLTHRSAERGRSPTLSERLVRGLERQLRSAHDADQQLGLTDQLLDPVAVDPERPGELENAADFYSEERAVRDGESCEQAETCCFTAANNAELERDSLVLEPAQDRASTSLLAASEGQLHAAAPPSAARSRHSSSVLRSHAYMLSTPTGDRNIQL